MSGDSREVLVVVVLITLLGRLLANVSEKYIGSANINENADTDIPKVTHICWYK